MKGFVEGQIIQIETDGENTPIDKYWRRRLKDAPFDNCVEAVTDSKSKKEDS